MFKWLFGNRNTNDTEVEKFVKKDPDLSFGNHTVIAIANALTNKNFIEATRLFEVGSWSDKSLATGVLGQSEIFNKTIAFWVETEPASYLAHLFKGANHIFLAWQARTAKRAKDVTEDEKRGFEEHIIAAENTLNYSISLNPNEAEAYARMIPVQMAFGDKNQVMYYFNKTIELEPAHVTAHAFVLNALKEKWLGSKREMYEFADNAIIKNSSVAMKSLMLDCFIEDAVSYLYQEGGQENFDNFFNNEQFRNDFFRIYNDFNSLNLNKPDSYGIRNRFCFLFYLMKDYKMAKVEFDKFEGYMTESPWNIIKGVSTNQELKAILIKKVKGL